MPGENGSVEASLDAVAESLFVGSEGGNTPAPKVPVNPSNRVAEGDDQAGEDDVDNSVDLEDVDLLEPGDADEGQADEEDYSDDIDPDETEHEVVVDGQAVKAKLKDLKSAYSGNKAIDQRLQQASELRKQSEVVATELMRQLSTQSDKLKQLDMILAEAENTNINWETLRVTDPQRYLIEKDKLQEIQNKRRLINDAQEETKQRQLLIARQQQAEYAKEQADILMQKIPDLRNPEKAKKMGDSWNKTAREYGFSDEEVAGIIDHRQLLVLTDAMKYRALVAAKAARQGKSGAAPRQAPKPLLRPGSQNFGAKMNAIKAEKAAMARAAQTGSIDDVAATLLVSAPRGKTKQTGF